MGPWLVGRSDLPIPDYLFAWAASVVLVVSFVGLAMLWPRPRLEHPRERTLLVVPAWLDVLGGALGIGLFALVVTAGLLGDQAVPQANLAPTFVFVAFWVGLVPLSVVAGNVFGWLNPWRALARAIAWAVTHERRPRAYPEKWGRWPAVLGLVAFGWLELVYVDRETPRTLAILALLYAAVQLAGARRRREPARHRDVVGGLRRALADRDLVRPGRAARRGPRGRDHARARPLARPVPQPAPGHPVAVLDAGRDGRLHEPGAVAPQLGEHMKGRLALLAAALAVGAVLVAVAVRADDSPEPRAPGLHGSVLPAALTERPAPAFRLADARGGVLDSRALRGRPYAVTFLYTRCPDVCPLLAQEIKAALQRMGPAAARITVVGISVDPRGDSPRAVRAWLRRQGLPDNFRYAVGSRRELAPVWRAYFTEPQIPDRPETSTHTASVWLIGADGRPRAKYSAGAPVPIDDLAADLKTLANEERSP